METENINNIKGKRCIKAGKHGRVKKIIEYLQPHPA